ncbi:unnamed protein product [Diplocarpon coronariae]
MSHLLAENTAAHPPTMPPRAKARTPSWFSIPTRAAVYQGVNDGRLSPVEKGFGRCSKGIEKKGKDRHGKSLALFSPKKAASSSRKKFMTLLSA